MDKLKDRQEYLAAIHAFQTEIAGFASYQVNTMPNLESMIRHDAEKTKPDLPVRPGLFVDQSEFATRTVEGSISPETCEFILQPAHRMGRDISNNKVFFGRVIINNSESGTSIEKQVAVKRTPDIETGLGELAMFQYMRSLQLPTFKPIGIGVGRDRRGYILTEFDKSVETLDTVDWQNLDIDERWQKVAIGTDTLIELHPRMLFHGDIAARNLASNDTDELRIVDPEHMVSACSWARILKHAPRELGRDDQIALLKLKLHMSQDFTDFFNTVNGAVFSTMPYSQTPKTSAARLKQYKKHIFGRYQAGIEKTNSPYKQVTHRVFEQFQSDLRRRADEERL